MLSNFPIADASKRKRKKLTRMEIFQKAFSLVGAIAFFGVTGSGLVKTYSTAFQANQEMSQSDTAATDEQANELAAREKGYQLVLEREPNNSVALEGLADTRIEMGDFEGATEPLKKLASIHPEEQRFRVRLNEVELFLASQQ